MNEIILANQNNELIIRNDIQEKLVELKREIDEKTAQFNSIKDNIMEYMKQNEIKSIKSDLISVSYTPAYKKIKFNETKFKKEHEEIYNDYCELSEVKESMRITPKKVKEHKPKKEINLDDLVIEL